MTPSIGSAVNHRVYGPGTIVQCLGEIATVTFFGDVIEVQVADLEIQHAGPAPVSAQRAALERTQLRRAYEAINLGVVPPSPEQLLAVTIHGPEMNAEMEKWLERTEADGLCKVFFGDYGSGKSHTLRFFEAVALRSGWVTSFVEFDPKQADPAKPHLVYRSIVSNLQFPARVDGRRAGSFFDLVREIRDNYAQISGGKYYLKSPWFSRTLASLRYFGHGPTAQYVGVIDWLAGQPINFPYVKSALRGRAGPGFESPPSMPRIRETAEIYVFHLVVLNEILRALGYKGLLIVLDEAEHVRGYNVRRQERANNFFDLLARSARPRVTLDTSPICNDHRYDLPKYWQEGPHFGLLVGLTEGETFSDPGISLRESCVFLDDVSDAIRLKLPSPDEYRLWCEAFLGAFYEYYPAEMHLLRLTENRSRIARVLATRFEMQPVRERTLRLWIKMASLVLSVIMAKNTTGFEELVQIIDHAARVVSNESD